MPNKYIITKYITKEILLYFIAIISLLFFIYITNTFIGLLTKVASGKLPFSMACQIMLLYTPEVLGLLMPIGLFIAVLFVISKLYANHEMVVLFMSGLSLKFLVKTSMIIASVVAVLTASLSLYVAPIAVKKREELLVKSAKLGLITSIVPGRFQLINDGKQVFYVGNIQNADQTTNQLQDILITNTDLKTDPLIITAKTGLLKISEDLYNNFLVLHHGHRYSGVIGSPNFSVVDFAEYGRQLLFKNPELVSSDNHRLQKTSEIWNSKNPAENAEWQWRLSMPISVLILTILAISLAQVSPRQGRFAKFLPAILLYIIYENGVIGMRRLLASCAPESIYSICGIWGVHLVFLVLSLVLLFQASGWLLYFRKKLF